MLDGDLIIKGGGDPKLLVEDLWLMMRQLRSRGIRDIRGDIVLDRTLFDVSASDPGRFDGEPFRPYNVAPDALLINFKAVTLTFVPDDLHRDIQVLAEPLLLGQHFGPIRYTDGPCGDWNSRLGADFSNPDRVVFSGSYAGSCGEKSLSFSAYSPSQYDGALLRSLWTELGGTVAGRVRDGASIASDRLLFVHESQSLAEVIRDINKFSNNVMARQLFLSTGAEVLKVSAQPERSQRVIKSFLASRDIPAPELILENGSGLSRLERISARTMAALLMAAWSSPEMPEFISSLPLVGIDGTMRRRLKGQPVAGRAHIKSGSLSDVRAVAGYVLAASGRQYAVVSMINHGNASAGAAAQDAFIQWVYEHGVTTVLPSR